MTEDTGQEQSSTTAEPEASTPANPNEGTGESLDQVAAKVGNTAQAADPEEGRQRRAPTSLDDFTADERAFINDYKEREVKREITNARQKWTERGLVETEEGAAPERNIAHSQSATEPPLTLEEVRRDIQAELARERESVRESAIRTNNVRSVAERASLSAEDQQKFADFITACAENPKKHGFDPALALLNEQSTLAMAYASGVLSPRDQVGPSGPSNPGAVYADGPVQEKARLSAEEALRDRLYGKGSQSASQAQDDIRLRAKQAIQNRER